MHKGIRHLRQAKRATDRLKKHHQEELRRSGLNFPTMDISGIYSVSREKAQNLLGFDPRSDGLAFPYSGSYVRIKPDKPFTDAKGKLAKYLSPKGGGNHLYVPPNLSQRDLQDTSVALLITEGEKKALKALQEGFPTIGLAGVWSWKDQDGIVSELRGVPLEKRVVRVCFDSDAVANKSVRWAEYKLARYLESMGAHVGIIRLPQLNDAQKTGLDDYLLESGPAEFSSLVTSAKPLSAPTGIYTLTDDGNGDRLVDRHGMEIRYCPGLKWLVWEGSRWVIDDSGAVERKAVETAKTIIQELETEEDQEHRGRLYKWHDYSLSCRGKSNMVDSAQAKEGVYVNSGQLDKDGFLLNVRNGTLDLRKRELLKHSPEYLITKQAPVEFDKNATCPTFSAFLDRILLGRADLIEFVQKTIGYSLSADIREQCFFIFYGSGANGKSTLLNTVSQMLGQYALSSQIETFIKKKNDAAPRNDIARLRGARFVSVTEGVEDSLDPGLVKQITGGDTLVARHLYKEFFEFDPTFKVFIASNRKPKIDDDAAMWRRVRLVPFELSIPPEKQDRQLPKKLASELPGILNWALEGFSMWQAEGLAPPKAVTAATESYRSESDTLRMFLDDRCVIDQARTITKGKLYEAWKEWCGENGFRPEDIAKFGNLLKRKEMIGEKRGRGGTRMWVGIGLKEPDFKLDLQEGPPDGPPRAQTW